MDQLSDFDSHRYMNSANPTAVDRISGADIDFFEDEVERFKVQLLQGTILDRRAQSNALKEDPLEELGDMYSDVQVVEADFKRTLEICTALIKNTREQVDEKRSLEKEIDYLKRKHQEVISMHQSSPLHAPSERDTEALQLEHENQTSEFLSQLETKDRIIESLNSKIYDFKKRVMQLQKQQDQGLQLV